MNRSIPQMLQLNTDGILRFRKSVTLREEYIKYSRVLSEEKGKSVIIKTNYKNELLGIVFYSCCIIVLLNSTTQINV